MGIARNIARLVPNGSGLLPNANIEAVAASKLTGQVPDANAPSGSVVQVVTGNYGSYTSTTSTTPVDTGLSASITPTSASNRILVFVSINGIERGSTSPIARFRLLRNSSDIFSFENAIFAGSTTTGYGNSSTSYLDSPSTTSATTYKVQWNISNNTGIIYINNYATGGAGTTNCTITLMEIAA